MTLRHALLAGVLLCSAAVTLPAAAQDDKTAIVQALLDYAEGYYGGEPARMTRAVSPYLTKRELRRPPNAVLGEMNADTLIDYSYGVKLAPDARHMTTEVLDVGPETASGRVFSAQFNDYAHLIKRNGTWQILDVLWHGPPPASAAGQPDQTAAVSQAVKQFVSAMTGAVVPDALSVLHPLAHVRILAAGRQGRSRTVANQNAEAFLTGLARGAGKLPGTVEEAQVVVEGIDHDIASARVQTGTTKVHLHLAHMEGRWRVVTMLRWTGVP
jgi:hypothetical protein